MRGRWRQAALAVLALAAPVAAQAHAILVESRPASGATVTSGPAELWLRFNSRIDAARSRVVLDSGAALPLDAPARPDVLTGHMALTPGEHVLHWQVLSVDGHITRGSVAFGVAAP